MKSYSYMCFYSNIARALANKLIHVYEGILLFAWILLSSHNNKDIKVSENSVKNFSDAHPPLKLCKDRNRVVTCDKNF